MKIVLNETNNLKVRLEIFMTGTEIAAFHRITADCDDLAACPKLVLPKIM